MKKPVEGWVPDRFGYEKGNVWCAYHAEGAWLKIQIQPTGEALEFAYLPLPLLQQMLAEAGLSIVPTAGAA